MPWADGIAFSLHILRLVVHGSLQLLPVFHVSCLVREATMSNDRDDDSSRLPPPVPVELPFSVAPPDDPPFDLQLLKQTITEVFTTFQPLQSSNQEMLAPTFFFLSRQFETLVSAVNNLNTTMIAQTITVTDMKLTVETQKEIVEQTIESQRQTTERLQKTLDIHTSKLSILARDAEK
ncbi:hypothetical protein SISSUDRAFT_1133268, partial [Sistotremastrum suecicum HHB10207 ss-3]